MSPRLALFSDVHANKPSLDAVLADMTQRGLGDSVYHLGDLVGYASQPNEVLECLHEFGISGVAGNYDSTVATGYKHCGCRADTPRDEELAHVSYEWTRAQTSDRTKRLLATLPFRIDLRPLGGHVTGPTVVLVHATPTNNLVYVTEDRSDDFLEKLAMQAGVRPGDALCFGHTHKPWHREVAGVHFINIGSVGRPKDGDPRAGYVVLEVDVNGIGVEFIRVDYDVEQTCEGIRAAGLPEEFAKFLRTGGHPVDERVAP